MSQGAKVTSSEAIEAFRTALLVYLSKARPLVEDASDEIFRTRDWLQGDRRMYWENQVRRRTKQLEDAQQALFSVSLSNLREARNSELAALQRARRSLNDAEEKLKIVKQWTRDFDSRVGPIVKHLEQLLTVLAHDIPRASAHLVEVIKRIDAYAGVTLSAAPPASSSVEAGKEEPIAGSQQERPGGSRNPSGTEELA